MSRGLHLAEPLPVDVSGGLLPHRAYSFAPAGASHGVGAPGIEAEDLERHHGRFGDRPSAAGHTGGVLLGMLEESGLTGCGGGHFPVARKWRSALRAGGGGILVANAAESEPASAKDFALLTAVPHLVLDGLACAAEALGSTEVIIWMHEGAHDAERAIALAVAERRAAGFHDAPLRSVTAPNRYLSGESSAILRGLAGGPVLPAFARQHAAVAGFRGRPAIVHNVETLARIGLLARTGVRGYRASALVTVTTAAGRVVLEIDERTTTSGAVRAAGWAGDPPQAVLVGGYGGSWLDWSTAAELRLMTAANAPGTAADLGAGVLMPLGDAECGVARTAEIVAFMADAGARQCGPCRFGLPELAERLQALARGKAGRRAIEGLRGVAGLVDGRGGCHHPDGVVRLVRSALQTFATDVERHARGDRCLARVERVERGV